MSKAESNQKIRQLAIVLSTMDREPALRILQSIPSELGTAVRKSISQLGSVTPQERQQAFETLRPVLQSFSSSPSSTSSPRRSVQSNELADFNPATQILQSSQAQNDVTEIRSVKESGPIASDAYRKSNSLDGVDSSKVGWIDWGDASSSVWAEVLQVERPILIATVLAHAPGKIASEILQQLPGSVAINTLAAMPKIGHTENEIYKEIAGQLKARLANFRDKSPSGGWGLNRALGIFESLPSAMRDQWVDQLCRMDESLAIELFNKASTTSTANNVNNPAVVHGESKSANVDASTSATGIKIAEHTKQVQDPGMDTYRIDRAFEAMQDSDSESRVAFDAEDFQALLQLSKVNLARVIQACEPNVVLVALSGATRNWISTFERLLDRRELTRFRERLRTLNHSSLEEVDEAQSRIVAAAVELGLFSIQANDLMAA